MTALSAAIGRGRGEPPTLNMRVDAEAQSPDAQLAIDLLQERRTALISAAVTGQIDVRGAVKSL